MDRDWGNVKIVLSEYLAVHQISKNQVEQLANLQRSQLIAYCKNVIQRPDLGVLARICYALRCEVSDIIRYEPPKTIEKEMPSEVENV